MQVNTPITLGIWNRKVVSDATPTGIRRQKGKPFQEIVKPVTPLLRKVQPEISPTPILIRHFRLNIQLR